MNDSLVFGKQGYSDWKRASQSIPRHERSAAHRNAVIQLLQRSDAGCRVDSELVRQASEDRDYWRAVLERITETIRYLSERGLPFRGSNEIVGSPKNGNYLGTLELIAVFDPFLAQHINRNANKGKRSYILSVEDNLRRVHPVDGNSCARAHLYRSENCQVFLRFCGLDPRYFSC